MFFPLQPGGGDGVGLNNLFNDKNEAKLLAFQLEALNNYFTNSFN